MSSCSSDDPGAGRPLPRIAEVKRTLAGREKRFECHVLAHAGTHVVVLYISPVAMRVHGVDLPAGTVTFGHFWTDRPYNVYHWLAAHDGATLGYYLNLASDTRIGADRLEWLDLVIDILVVPDQPPVVLDADEVPADLDAALRARIEAARVTALADLPRTLVEMKAARETLWPSVRMRRGDPTR